MSDLKFKLQVNRVTEKGAQLILKNVRGTFVRIASPSEGSDDIDPAYEITALIPKKNKKEVDKILELITETVKLTEKYTKAEERKKALSTSKKIHGDGAVIKDGNKTKDKTGKIYEGLEGHFILKAKTGAKKLPDGNFVPKVKFAIKDKFNSDIPADKMADELYSGAWYDIAVTLQAYKFMKNRGVTVYLNGVQKLKNGERIGGYNPFEVRDDVEEDMGAYDADEEY